MSKLITIILMLIISNNLFAQIEKKLIYKRGKTAYVEHIKKKKTKNRKYQMSKFFSEFVHTIHLKDGSVIDANSDIIKDAEDDNYYLYFIDHNNELKKAYPEDTKYIEHANPYYDNKKIIGYPKNNRWLFTLNEGKISTFSYSCTEKHIDYYSINNAQIKNFADSYELFNLLKSNNKSFALLRKKEYYKAIHSYNKSIKSP